MWAEFNTHRFPQLKMLFAIPNGGKRNVITAANMKREGVKPGVPDLFLAFPSNGYHGLFIEMKKRKGGKVSDSQREWIRNLTACGYMAEVCEGWEKAVEIITKYLKPRNTSEP